MSAKDISTLVLLLLVLLVVFFLWFGSRGLITLPTSLPGVGRREALRYIDDRLSVCEDRPMAVITCPRCKSTMIARSHRRNFLERLLRFVWIRPYSCTKCGRRFWGRRDRR